MKKPIILSIAALVVIACLIINIALFALAVKLVVSWL